MVLIELIRVFLKKDKNEDIFMDFFFLVSFKLKSFNITPLTKMFLMLELLSKLILKLTNHNIQ